MVIIYVSYRRGKCFCFFVIMMSFVSGSQGFVFQVLFFRRVQVFVRIIELFLWNLFMVLFFWRKVQKDRRRGFDLLGLLIIDRLGQFIVEVKYFYSLNIYILIYQFSVVLKIVCIFFNFRSVFIFYQIDSIGIKENSDLGIIGVMLQK